jgi:hypothetical protein
MTIRGAVADNRSVSGQRTVVVRPSPFVLPPSSFVLRRSAVVRPLATCYSLLATRYSSVIPNAVRDHVVLATVRGDAAQIPRTFPLPLISHLAVYQADIHLLLVCRQAHEWLGMTIWGAVADSGIAESDGEAIGERQRDRAGRQWDRRARRRPDQPERLRPQLRDRGGQSSPRAGVPSSSCRRPEVRLGAVPATGRAARQSGYRPVAARTRCQPAQWCLRCPS